MIFISPISPFSFCRRHCRLAGFHYADTIFAIAATTPDSFSPIRQPHYAAS
jgi:hypothetical protein